jgi:hypothetical protein
MHFDTHHRLEPRPSHRTDLQRGFMAQIADPAWFVGRQWQMGEHQGANAASPVLAYVTYGRRPLQPTPGRAALLPGHRVDVEPADAPPLAPAEAMIEGESDDWWTLGRRVRIGLTARAAVDALVMTSERRAAFRLPDLPEPYAEFSGGYDGLELYRGYRAGDLMVDADLFDAVPGDRRDDHWLPADLKYGRVDFPCDSGAPSNHPDSPHLTVLDHDGGDVEWWSADAAGDWSAPIPEPLRRSMHEVQLARFTYPGAPHPRWWQIEDARVDIGGLPPDRSHFASLLLLDLVLSHSDDWFTLALEAQVGDVVTIEDLVVVDLFRDEYSWTTHAALRSPADWSLFRVAGLDSASLVLWPSVAVPIVGEALEEVALGVDEDANLMWAVEERAEGLRLTSIDLAPPDDPAVEPHPSPDVAAATTYLYRPSTSVPHLWHPYVLREVAGRRTFVQGRLRQYTVASPHGDDRLAPEPVAQLLKDAARVDGDPMHQIAPAVVPPHGLRLDRRYVLARQTNGTPVLWVQRQRLPLLSPPTSGLRFDVMRPVSP